MAPLSKLTLTSYRRTQSNRDPVEARRSKSWLSKQRSKDKNIQLQSQVGHEIQTGADTA